MFRILVPALVTFLCAGPSRAQQLFEGCYDLEMTEPQGWSAGADSVYYRPPPRIRLDVAQSGGRNPIAISEGSVPSPHGRSFWSAVGDTLQLVWSTGFVGVQAKVTQQGAVLRGESWPFTDAGGFPPEARSEILMRPVDCAQPASNPAGAIRRFAPVIVVDTGVEVRLGDRVPEGLRRSVSGRGYVVSGRARGVATGSEELRISTDSANRVDRLTLRYPSTQDVAELRRRLVAEFGAWHGREEVDGSESWYWQGRMESVLLTEVPDGRTLLHFRRVGIPW